MMTISRDNAHFLFQCIVATLLISGTILFSPRSAQAGIATAVADQATTTPIMATWQSSGIIAVAGNNGARLRDRPGGTIAQILSVGFVMNAVGRTADSAWLAVQLTDGTTGWVATDELILFGIERLPVESGTVVSGTVVSETVVSETVVSETVVSEAVVGSATVVGGATTVSDVASSVTARVVLTGSRLNVRAGPATNYAIVGKAAPAADLILIGRNAMGDWVQIQLAPADATSPETGWVASRYLAITGSVEALPVVEATSTAPTDQAVPQLSDGQNAVRQSVAVVANTANASNGSTAGRASGLSGTLVFQSSPGGMIYGYRLATGALWTLTNGFDPAISPDGQTVAFVREGGENGIYRINIDGSDERLIFSGRTRLSSPKWSPDGQWILFTRSDEYSECVSVGPGGCVSINALPPGIPTAGVVISKDYKYKLARVDQNGDNYRDIAALESARVADWNEAGIVYQSSAGLQITADSADAINRLLLFTPLQPPYEDPDWQPNGGRIAFVQHHGSHYEIFTINADGSGMTALTRPVTTLVDQMPNNLAPAWSPDGQQIVFLSNRDAGNEAGAWRIWVMDADGSNQHPLPINVPINYTYGNEQAVSWGSG